MLIPLVIIATLWDRYSCYLHFIDVAPEETERLSKLPKVTRLLDGRAGMWTQMAWLAVWTQPFCYISLQSQTFPCSPFGWWPCFLLHWENQSSQQRPCICLHNHTYEPAASMTVLCICAPDPVSSCWLKDVVPLLKPFCPPSFSLAGHIVALTHMLYHLPWKKNSFFDSTSVHLIPAAILFFFSLLQPSSSEEGLYLSSLLFPFCSNQTLEVPSPNTHPFPQHTHLFSLLIHWS